MLALLQDVLKWVIGLFNQNVIQNSLPLVLLQKEKWASLTVEQHLTLQRVRLCNPKLSVPETKDLLFHGNCKNEAY